jgi:plastocyanin
MKAISSNDRRIKHRKAHDMFASPIQPYRRKHLIGPGGATSAYHRYLNTCALAVALFVAVALLAGIGAEEGRARSPVLSENGHAEVVLEKLRFSPQILSVPVGTTVTWINRDSVPKIVVSAEQPLEVPPILRAGQTFSRTFATAGTYSYFCSVHPGVTGKIVVR